MFYLLSDWKARENKSWNATKKPKACRPPPMFASRAIRNTACTDPGHPRTKRYGGAPPEGAKIEIHPSHDPLGLTLMMAQHPYPQHYSRLASSPLWSEQEKVFLRRVLPPLLFLPPFSLPLSPLFFTPSSRRVSLSLPLFSPSRSSYLPLPLSFSPYHAPAGFFADDAPANFHHGGRGLSVLM